LGSGRLRRPAPNQSPAPRGAFFTPSPASRPAACRPQERQERPGGEREALTVGERAESLQQARDEREEKEEGRPRGRRGESLQKREETRDERRGEKRGKDLRGEGKREEKAS